MRKKADFSKKISYKIAILYFLLSFAWIYSTDWILSFFNDLQIVWVSTIKAGVFVTATAILLYKLIKKNVKAIEDREKKLISLIENNMDAIIRLDEKGNVVFVNDIAVSVTGYSKEELTEMSFQNLIYKEDLENVRRYFCETEIGKSFVVECKCVTKNGNCIIASIKSVPIVIEDKIVGTFVIVRDITELKDKEELIRKSEKLSIVGELAAAVAHEIRNPLTSIKGFLQLLQYKATEEKDIGYYDIMLSEIERINFIVSEFMVLSKPQSISYRNENISSLLTDVVTLLETIAIVKNIEVTKELEPDIMVNCEANQIKQVFINIFKNAIEAVPKNGKIKIEITKWEEDTVRVRFTDNGRGIPGELLSRLGEPFYTTKEKGTGLGLMVSFKIIEEHRGTITIESEINKGTIVDIILPVSKGN
jgi:two-component system sporulation sensor kinase A/two-component system, sporulation sensor kinase E